MDKILNNNVYSDQKYALKNVLYQNWTVPFLSFQQPNPKQNCEMKTSTRYANYMNSKKPKEFFANGGKFVDFIWDIEHKYISFDDNMLSTEDFKKVYETYEMFNLIKSTRKCLLHVNQKFKKIMIRKNLIKEKEIENEKKKRLLRAAKIADTAMKIDELLVDTLYDDPLIISL